MHDSTALSKEELKSLVLQVDRRIRSMNCPIRIATTSCIFKRDLVDLFYGREFDSVLEVSGRYGVTTNILSYLFNNVIYVEHPLHINKYIDVAREINNDRTNITYIKFDVYKNEWDFPPQDCVLIDCNHRYNAVCQDIDNALKILKPDGLLVFHDYSYNTANKEDTDAEEFFGVRVAVHEAVNKGKLAIVKFIGNHYAPTQKYEGVVCVRQSDIIQRKKR